MEAQINEKIIKSQTSYYELFHEHIELQHNQYYFYNKQHSIETLTFQEKKYYQSLNIANVMLGRFCKKIVDDMIISEEPLGTLFSNSIHELRGLIYNWQEKFNQGEAYNTFDNAFNVFEILKKSNYPLNMYQSDMVNVQKRFLNIPHKIKTFVHLSSLVNEYSMVEYLEKLIIYLIQNPALSYYLKELRIDYDYLINTENEKYRVVKLVLLPEIVNTPVNPVIGDFTNMLTQLNDFDQILFLHKSPKYSLEATKNVFIAQGNNNYKRFLELLGILSEVYDITSNHALILHD